MRTLGIVSSAMAFLASFTSLLAQETLIAGQNINMVAGTEWPGGDPFLNKQNEGTIAVSSRNELHLMAGSNDYRSVDLPGLPEGKTVGDSWISTYFSSDGGGTWHSTLLPGYPQDVSALGLASPLRTAFGATGYEATADPVLRSGTNGLFYYSGIAFTREDNAPSAGFVATYMDLNNDERGNSIGYVRTALYDQDNGTNYFVDKPWIAVDKPRSGSQIRVLDVHTENGAVVQQTVNCGKVYAAYAQIVDDGSASVRSRIMVSHSDDCAETFSDPLEVSGLNTINQGAAVAIDPFSGDVQVAWRQFENPTLNCTYQGEFWWENPDAWPVAEIEIAGETYQSVDAAVFPGGEGIKGGRPWQVLRELVAAWLNVLSGASRSDEVAAAMAEAEAWLVAWPPGSKPRKDDDEVGNDLRRILRDYNQGKLGLPACADLMGDVGNNFLGGLNPNAIMVVRSTNGGESFSDPVQVTGADYFPFDQGTTEFSFRTLGFPTMAFDGSGRSYIAYSTRGLATPNSDPVGGDARIAVTTSLNGTNWTPQQAIDQPEAPGHQIMPALEVSRGKVFLLYYDFRQDSLEVFDRFIVDYQVLDDLVLRHTTDVRAAVAAAADVPQFTDYSIVNGGSTQASRYPFLVLNNGGMDLNQPLKLNLPNLPVAKDGSVPFFGDYLDIAGQDFYFDETTLDWEFDTNAARGAPVVHAVWTDNRDVIPPPDGDWQSYVPPTYPPVGEPGSGEPRPSIFDGTTPVDLCTLFVADRTQMRNQNVYTSRLTQGSAAAIPGNNRPLGEIGRAFVIFAQNTTNQDKTFRLRIALQPLGGEASFDQFSPPGNPVTEEELIVKANSSISRSVFVTSSDPSASTVIQVFEVAGGFETIVDTLLVNPDASAPLPDDASLLAEEIYTPAIFNPAIFNPAIFNADLLGEDDIGILSALFNPAIFNDPIADSSEFIAAALVQNALLNPAIFNPAIFNPAIFNPAIFNPAIFNPAIFNPAIFNPAIFNPAIFNLDPGNPAIFNPAIFNPAIFNPAIFNPAIFNPAIFNPAIFNPTMVETSAVIENTGNATAAYSLNLDLQDPPEGFLFQVMIYKTYLVPIAEGCDVIEQVVQEELVNELTPDVDGDLSDPDSTSFYIEPGDNVVVSVRIVPDPDAFPQGDPTDIDELAELNLSTSVVPQAVDTVSVNAGVTEPKPVAVLAPSLAGTGVVDQQQLSIDPVVNFNIGGVNNTLFAQAVTAGLTGLLTEVRLPIECTSGDLFVEIQRVDEEDNAPNGVVLATRTVAGVNLPAFPGGVPVLRSIPLSNATLFNAGEQFAIVLSSDGLCEIAAGPSGDSYAGGDAFGRSDTTPFWITPGREDLPFQTVVLGAGGGPANPLLALDAGVSFPGGLGQTQSITPRPGGGYFVVDSAVDVVFEFNVAGAPVGPGGIFAGGAFAPDLFGDGGLATSAQLNNPFDLAVAADGTVYIADRGNSRVRKVDPVTGIITTVAGFGLYGYTGGYNAAEDGGPGTAAQLCQPQGLDLLPDGNLLIADTCNNRIRHLDTTTGIITTWAGTGAGNITGNGGSRTLASVGTPRDIKVGPDGRVFIWANNRIRAVSTGGIIDAYAGDGTQGDNAGDGTVLATASDMGFGRLKLDVSPDNQLLIADSENEKVWLVDAGGFLWNAAGGSKPPFFPPPFDVCLPGELALFPGEPAQNQCLGQINDVTALPDGRVLVVLPDNTVLELF